MCEIVGGRRNLSNINRNITLIDFLESTLEAKINREWVS
jgi:hypothetical protein